MDCDGFVNIFQNVDAGGFGAAGFPAAACTSGLIHRPLVSDKPGWDELVKW